MKPSHLSGASSQTRRWTSNWEVARSTSVSRKVYQLR